MLADAALGYEYVTAYGRTKIEEDFAESVMKTQGRLMANNFVVLDYDRVLKIYKELL